MAYEAFSESEPVEQSDPSEKPFANEASDNTQANEPEPIVETTEPAQRQPGWLSGNRGLFIGLGIGIAVTIGATRFLPNVASSPATEAPPAQLTSSETKAGQAVSIANVETGPVARSLEATGTVAAHDLLPVLPKATGLQIKEVYVDEGDYVEAGQILAILDNSVLQTQIDQAKAQVQSAKAGVSDRQAAISQAEAGLAQAQAARSEADAGLAQAQANLAKAKADLAQAQSERERYQQLANTGAISQIELDKRRTAADTAAEAVRVAEANIKGAEAKIQSAEANVESAEARLKSASAGVESAQAEVRSSQAGVDRQETQLEQTLVRAPASGKIAERIARVGDVTGGNQRLFTIIRNSRLELQAKVPETLLPQIKIGSSVNITSDADSRIKLEGNVREIAPTIDPKSREATVEIDLPASDLLKPGMFLRASITTNTAMGLTVPAKAILPQPDGSAIVYVLQPDKTVKSQKVEKGEIIQGSLKDLAKAKIEIKTGLTPDQKVVVDGAGYLKDGDKVKVIESQEPVPDAQL